MGILDYFAGNSELREQCSELWRRQSGLKNELASLDSRIARLAGEREYNEAQYKQLESASLRDGELVELEEEIACNQLYIISVINGADMPE